MLLELRLRIEANSFLYFLSLQQPLALCVTRSYLLKLGSQSKHGKAGSACATLEEQPVGVQSLWQSLPPSQD